MNGEHKNHTLSWPLTVCSPIDFRRQMVGCGVGLLGIFFPKVKFTSSILVPFILFR